MNLSDRRNVRTQTNVIEQALIGSLKRALTRQLRRMGHIPRRRHRRRHPSTNEEKLDFIGLMMKLTEKYQMHSRFWRICKRFTIDVLQDADYVHSTDNSTELVEELSSLLPRIDYHIELRSRLRPRGPDPTRPRPKPAFRDEPLVEDSYVMHDGNFRRVPPRGRSRRRHRQTHHSIRQRRNESGQFTNSLRRN